MELFDAHCHLQDQALFSNLEEKAERAAAAGVARMVCCGTNSGDWNRVLQCPEKYPQIVPMLGIHPWFVSGDWKESFQTLEKRLRDFPNIGIGETGLDFRNKFTNRAEQEACFKAHLKLAAELGRPLAVHSVQAWGPMLEILRGHPQPKKIMHAFGGAVELIPELTGLNSWFSFCGSVTNPNARRVRAAAAAVPDDRLLVETDSPECPPAGCPAPNEPANLIHVVRAVSKLRKTSVEQIAALTTANAEKVLAVNS
jgi:TatD DNase family protein